MKKINFLFGMLLLMAAAHSQNLRLTTADNAYQSGDVIVKQQVEWMDAGAFGQGIEWDFAFLQPINTQYEVRYFHPDSTDMTLICGREPSARFYYRQRGDTLYAVGFENNTSIMNYFAPEIRLKFPMNFGDTLYSTFAGNGQYGRRVTMNVGGYTRVKYDATGTLKVPDFPNGVPALRTHTQRYYTQATMDSLQMKIDTWSWYVQGTRYPVFESIKTAIVSFKHLYNGDSIAQDTTTFQTSFYYPPTEQTNTIYSQQGSENQALTGAAAVFTKANFLPNPVVESLYVSYTLTRNANIWFSLHSNGGVPLFQTSPSNKPAGYNQAVIPMGSLIQGTYTLFVHVDDMVLMENIIKR
jgi:hypothetical protein